MQTHPKKFKQALKIIAAISLMTACFSWAWNAAMPMLFELSEIRFREALALLLLLAIPSFLLGRRRSFQDGADELRNPA